MLACSLDHWRAAGIDPVVVGMADETHLFAPTLTEVGYEVHLLPRVRSVSGLAALWRTLGIVRPQIVHIHSESCYDAVALLAALSPGVEGIVRTVHNNFRFTGQLRIRRTMRVAFARRLGVVWVACSSEVAATERSYSPHRPTRVVENWVDVDRIRVEATSAAAAGVRRELGIAPDVPVLALIGNCGGGKNHELIPEALQTVETPVELLHAGQRRQEPEAEAEAWRNLPARHTVRHLGGRDDVPALLAASDLVLLPSLYEGFSLVAGEALCAGVPVLAADTVGQQWLTAMRSATLLPLQPRAWAAAITRTLAEGPRSEATEASAAEARARLTPQRGVAEYVEAYQAALGHDRSFGAGGSQRCPSTDVSA
jgi:glycosyltransferase involved in cell wall biosynthesis